MGKVRDGPNWKKIRAEYIKGGISQRKLAEKYGVSYDTLKRRSSLEGWSDKRNDCDRKTTAILPQKIAESEAERMARLAATGNEVGEMILELVKLDLTELLKSRSTKITRQFSIEKEGSEPIKETEEKDLGKSSAAYSMTMRTLGLDAGSKMAREKLKLDSGIDQMTEDDGFLDALDGAQPDAWSIEDEPQNIGDSESEVV